MRKSWIRLTLTVIVIVYAVFGIRGWLGVEDIASRNQDNTYTAYVYSRSTLFVPFMKTHKVLVPSYGDLNSHTVFETYGFWQRVDIQWVDSQNLQVTCRHCKQTTLSMNKVDSINVQLINQ
jgi:hypothetical protein